MVSVFVPGRLGISPGRHLALEHSVSQGWERPTCTENKEVGRSLAGTGVVWLEQV